MRPSLRVAIVVFLTAAVSACNIYGCKYETRFVGTLGSASRADVGTVTAEYVNFRDHEEGETAPRSLTYSVHSTGLIGQPKRLTLRDRRDTTKVIVSMNLVGTTGQLAYGSYDLAPPAEREAMFRLLSSGNGVLVLEMQAPNIPPLILFLDAVTVENWHRARCD
ncbi:MAG TPA: hypothetical protein VFZ21_27520 [Gemmatimonadaceae bacterium]|jgi:hypothetical protein|nr:hypothetical protein [Gemmatimonadaceae bacterium]